MGREREGEGESIRMGWKWESTKTVAPERNIFGIWGYPLGATTPCHTILESSFHEQNLTRR